jgi:hypothetical protein
LQQQQQRRRRQHHHHHHSRSYATAVQRMYSAILGLAALPLHIPVILLQNPSTINLSTSPSPPISPRQRRRRLH